MRQTDLFSLFEMPNTLEDVEAVAEKVKKKQPASSEAKTRTKAKGKDLSDIKSVSEQCTVDTLSYYKDRVRVINTEDEFVRYIDGAVKYGYIAVDTETNKSLDPLTCKLMGLCLYYPGDMAVYVPVNHCDLSGNLLTEQISCEIIGRELSRLDNTKIIMHNGKFDYEVLLCTCGADLEVWWDTMLGAQILNENEKAGLKTQYMLHVDDTVGKYSIEGLYKNIGYEYISPEVFSLYAATDALITFGLYEYQYSEMMKKGNERLYYMFREVEMPVLKVSASMELRGISIDKEYAKRLSDKYHKIADEVESRISAELDKLKGSISEWRTTKDANYHPPKAKGTGDAKSKSEQLSDPPSLSSTTQMAIILYDVLKIPPVNKDKPRSTGEADLVTIAEKYDVPLCKILLEKREIEKLLGTYIDKLPASVSEKDGRLHAEFNQMGTEESNVKTGRFSSKSPNLQNVPSKNHEIRLLFAPLDGYTLVGADYSFLM